MDKIHDLKFNIEQGVLELGHMPIYIHGHVFIHIYGVLGVLKPKP